MRPAPAGQDRGRRVQPDPPPDGAGRRLQARRRSRDRRGGGWDRTGRAELTARRGRRGRRLRRIPLRPRLVVIFGFVAGATCAALAVTSYLLVQRARFAEAVDEARRSSLANLRLAANFVPASPGETDLG